MNGELMIAGAIGVTALLAQTGALFFWGGKVTRSLDVLEQQIERHEQTLEKHDARMDALDRRKEA